MENLFSLQFVKKCFQINKDPKKALVFETKKLEVLLAMVREPEEKDALPKEEAEHL